jgi:ElaB/YqjD/DUF883 family membrane-anchored ribosome-binding protein
MEDAVTADAVLSHELKSLHEELSASHRERTQAADPPSATETADASYAGPDDTAEELVRNELREFTEMIKELAEEAEKSMAAHPAAVAVGALVLGILIGRLLGRR